MVGSGQLAPGMTVQIGGKLFRVESTVKVTMAKGPPFIKTKLRNLANEKLSEKNFKVGQEVNEVSLEERELEFLYLDQKEYLFLDIHRLDLVRVPPDVIGEKVNFLKEGIQVAATFYGETIFSIDLPQFLELMIAKTDAPTEGGNAMSGSTKPAVLETGAVIDVPRFVESGDVIKVDTREKAYIQRV